MKDVAYGVIGGAIGAAVWAGVVYFTEYEQETVVRSAVEVALADGSIGPEEQRMITEIADAVDISESHLRGILSRLAAGVDAPDDSWRKQ